MNEINEINKYAAKYKQKLDYKLLFFIKYLIKNYKQKIDDMEFNLSNFNDETLTKVNNMIHKNNIKIKEFKNILNEKKKYYTTMEKILIIK